MKIISSIGVYPSVKSVELEGRASVDEIKSAGIDL